MGPDKGRGLGIKSAWFYAFFIAQDEFTDHLPLRTPGIDVSRILARWLKSFQF